MFSSQYIGWSDVIVICGHIAISMLWGNTAYCVKLGINGDDVSENVTKFRKESSDTFTMWSHL